QTLQVQPVYHRKLWEQAFVLQALFEKNKLRAGQHGLGFGCGEEPLPSFFASKNLAVTVTDLDPQLARESGWVTTGQHASCLEKVFRSELVSREQFDEC